MPIIVNKEEKVKEICNKAFDEFTEHGIENFSLNQFIHNNQISKGQFYHYFKTKEDLIFEVMSQKTVEMIERVELLLNDSNSLINKLFSVFAIYIDDSEEISHLRKLMFDTFDLYMHTSNPKVKEFDQELYTWIDEKLVSLFVEANQQKPLSDGIFQIVKSISATADGMYIRSLLVSEYDLKSELMNYLCEIEKLIDGAL